jgi:formyltetrahydrofolate hydrolase
VSVKSAQTHILTLACADKPGLTAKVTSHLFERGGNIIEAQQFNDEAEDSFFMRIGFGVDASRASELASSFAPLADELGMEWRISEAGARVKTVIMQILSDEMACFLEGRCINIHHSFLPGFKGAKPYHQAHARGVKMIGATAHYVTADLDEGPIIHQDVETVTHADSPEELVRKGRDIERRVLAEGVRLHLEDRVLLNAGKTVVFKS